MLLRNSTARCRVAQSKSLLCPGLAILLCLACLADSHCILAAEAPRPNIVLILADDLGYGDVGSFNKNCPFKTPRLDQLADQGARLTSFSVPTPFCAPSRGTILTGRYPFRHTVVHNPAPDAGISNFGLPASEVTIAELLKPLGYATAAIGKWHLGHKPQWLPTTQGFDEYLGILYSNDMFPVQLVRNDVVVEYPVIQSRLTQRYTDQAIRFIEEHRDEPFFLYLPHAMPHKPLAASEQFYTPDTPDDLYADVIAEMDFSIGRLLDRLDELSLAERTLVIFTSDNGPWYGGSTGGLRGMKGRTWEGGLRVPLIARYPGVIPAGVINSHPAGAMDLLPTICALTGAALPADRQIDGENILPLLQDPQAEAARSAIFGMQSGRLACIRSGAWKLHVISPGPASLMTMPAERLATWIDPRSPDGVALIAPYEQPRPVHYPGASGGDPPQAMMLFNLETDPGEQHNVAQQHPDLVVKLKGLFDEMNVQVPEFPEPEREYLLPEQPRGKPQPLMHLLGGELRYDRLPPYQRELIENAGK